MQYEYYRDIEFDATYEVFEFISVNNNSKIRKKVIFELFLENHQHAIIFFTGSTKPRTRLYRMAIGNNLSELTKTYDIKAILDDGEIVSFKKDTPCKAFLIENKR